MVKSITKIGNSQGLVFDAALLRQARLQAGDPVNIEVHAGGTITLTPLRSQPSAQEIEAIVEATMNDYADTMRKLA